jgi:glycosyltransferase involved in cell wall biosynthesis
MARILYLDHAPIFGGAEVVLLNLIRELDRSRWTPLVATAAGSPLLPALADAQIDAVTVPFDRLNRAGATMPIHLIRAIRSVSRLIRQRRIDLVYTNTVRAHIVGSLAAVFTRTPIVWTLHDNTFPRLLARMLAFIPRRVIAVSNWLRHLYAPLNLAHKITVIHNGLSTAVSSAEAAGLRNEMHIPADAPLVVNVGRLVAGKAPHLFVEAASRVAQAIPAAVFALVGEPDPIEPGQPQSTYDEVLANAVRDCHLGSNLIMTGHRSDVARFYAAADLVVYCSVSPEGLPTVLLEAMCYARPVVATSVGGAPEIVVDQQTGRLVAPGDSKALATAIVDLLMDRQKALAFGAAGQTRLAQEFRVEQQAAQVDQVYRAILGERA